MWLNIPLSIHPIRQLIQGLISLALPSFAFFAHAGSASCERPKATKSAFPSASIFSASSGEKILWPMKTGMFTASFSIFVCLALNAFGSRNSLEAVAWVPPMIFRWDTPSFSNAFATSMVSSIRIPSGSQSSVLNLIPTGKFGPHFFLMFLTISRSRRMRLCREPPYISVRLLSWGDRKLVGIHPAAPWISIISKPAFLHRTAASPKRSTRSWISSIVRALGIL